MTIAKTRVTTVVLDLDNTLWDWVHIWYEAFSAELDALLRISGVERETLLDEIRQVHRQHGTSEYAFLIAELPSLQALHPNEDLVQVYAEAITAYRVRRREVLRLYPNVEETLSRLKSAGCTVIAYTESMAYYTSYRVRKLALDHLIDLLYSPADHDLPRGLSADAVRKYPAATYELSHTRHRHTPAGELKPNPTVLLSILADAGSVAADAIYVGDSLMKDVSMAQDAGVVDVYAEYGHNRDGEAYEMLRRVTHWTDADVERERRIHARGEVTPTYVLSESLRELFDLFHFGGNVKTFHGRK